MDGAMTEIVLAWVLLALGFLMGFACCALMRFDTDKEAKGVNRER